MSARQIELRGVRVNNLKGIDLDIPHGQFVSICGVSGSGKSSLAFDTLYAEGQRRYFESLSTWTRQYLDQLEKPNADRIEGIPPAIAIRASRKTQSGDRHRTTVGTASEVVEYLRLLFAKIGKAFCANCDLPIQRNDPDTVVAFLDTLPVGTRYQIAFVPRVDDSTEDKADLIAQLKRNGFRRLIADGKTLEIDEVDLNQCRGEIFVVVDRLTADPSDAQRARESLETAFEFGNGVITLLIQDNGSETSGQSIQVDSRIWLIRRFSRTLACTVCRAVFPIPSTELFSFSNPAGACRQCEGFGKVLNLDMNLIVPDGSKSIRAGAIAPWNTPAYEHERIELIELADDYGIPLDTKFEELSDETVQKIWDGVPERDFGGLNGFFNWLEKRKYKIQIAVFLNRWKSSKTCDQCQGHRLNSEALAFRIGGKSIADICELEIRDASTFMGQLKLSDIQQQLGGKLIGRIAQRLHYLNRVDLGYLTLDRSVASLSSGESQRVMLTKVLGSTLSGMLYVLDEPSVGLHPINVPALVDSIRALHARGNTVVVVDHEERIILGADRIVETGPEAGSGGGEIVFDGSAEHLVASDNSVTGDFINHRRGLRDPERRRRPGRGTLKLTGASGHNLKQIDVEFPLNCLCVVTGISGSGKSSLVKETLYPALCQQKNRPSQKGLPFSDLFGSDRIDEVVLIDQSPPGKSSRSNPVTYVKAFDEIRKAFADTVDAKTRNFKAGHFSFNVEGGRCESCKGDGQLKIDMQFMSDIYVRCDTCNGTRFRDEILDVRYRAKNIDDVLSMTVREAFGFFRGKTKVQARIKALIDVGLDYIRLGQPATTLSNGESQRLKLAHYLNAGKSKRALFLMDEPTYGLHMRDVVKLVDCFETLVAAGHSMIVVEHNLQLMKYADWVIDLGPGASAEGGNVVACGTPEEISEIDASSTGSCLKALLFEEKKVLEDV